ncbi:oocyte zinc finger protein XlCOF8.4-like [Eleutherodactylus coqui]|uniref:oocyte zinc finger protein XlCOF8.4-like n=1 Tax=Eleutherodactylus coqui TaxID=57060 RepID=UPI00346353B1
MAENRKEITRRILDFTLEILYLLTGEDYTIVKKTSGDGVTPIIHLQESGGWSRSHFPITEPPSPIHEQKILELTNKMMELLAGEVPIRCQDVAVYFSMEEWEYIGGQKDLYEEVMMENCWPLTSQDGASRRNPPERCPRPLYSQDCPEEDPDVPEDHQEEDLTIIKVEVEEERMMDDHPWMRHMNEELPVDVTTENPSKNAEGNFMLSVSYKVEDEDLPQHSSQENLLTLNVHPGLHITDLSYNPPNHEEPPPDRLQIVCLDGKKSFQYNEQFIKSSGLYTHRRSHTVEKTYSCSECEKSFIKKSHLDRHKKTHTGEKPYACAECGKCFLDKSSLVIHERSHTGEKPFSCSECGKCFSKKSNLVKHLRIHTGEKPYSCSLCGKRFTNKSDLVKHGRTHTGEKPYSCSFCSKCFTDKSGHVKHERSHTGVKLF